MKINDFEDALENIENTILNMELCKKVVEFYETMPENEARQYEPFAKWIKYYYHTFLKVEEQKNDAENNLKISKTIQYELEKSIQDLADKEQIAFMLYYELNNIFSYDSEYLITEDQARADQIYDQNPDNIDLEKRKIICTTWAKMYASLLNKNGIDAIINQDGIHYNVIFKIGSIIYTADAMDINYEKESQSYMNDLTRTKLGIAPNSIVNLYATQFLEGYDYDTHVKEVYETMSISLKNEKLQETALERFQKLYDSKGKNLREIFGIDENTEISSVLDKLTIIHTLIKNTHLEDTELIQYINNLIYVLLNEQEDTLVIDTTITSKDTLAMHKILAIGNESMGYVYCIVDSNGVNKIEAVKLAELLNKGNFIVNNNTTQRSNKQQYSKKYWKYDIPGFFEDSGDKGGRDE